MATNAPAAPTATSVDEIDPELISLKRKRAGIGPVLAACVIILCVYLLISLRADFGFALSGKSAASFGDARAAYAAGKTVPDNTYVTVGARLDLSHPGWLRGKQAIGYRVAPVLGSSGRLWVQITDDSRAEATVYDLAYTGRTRRIADLAFRDELADYVGHLPLAPRWLAPDTLATAAGKTELTDVHGDRLVVTPDTPVELNERVAGVALVTVYQNDVVKDEAGARAALTAAGLTPAAALARSTDKSWTFEVPAPDGLPGVRAALSKASLYAAMASDSVSDEIVSHVGSWKDFVADGTMVKLADGKSFPLSSVANVVAHVKPTLPADAEIVLVGDDPARFWYMLPLYGVLALVLGLMAWALVRALRSDGPTALPLTFKPPEVPSDTP
jgi:hypothetical protein